MTCFRRKGNCFVHTAPRIRSAVFRIPTGFPCSANVTSDQSAAVVSESFGPALQLVNREIHTVFLQFSNFDLYRNLLPTILANWIIGY